MNNTNEISINLADVFAVFFKRLWLILLAAIIVGGGVYSLLANNYVENYTSRSTIMVMNPEENLSASSSAYYYSLTITAVNDCAQLLTSRSVLYRIIDELELDDKGFTYNSLKNMISITNYPDSHVIEVAVTTEDAWLSRDIVNSLCRLGAAQIEEYIEFATAKVIDEGTLSRSPSNSVGIEYAIMAGLAAGALVFGLFILAAVRDDKLKTPEDIEIRLGLSVLGIIPYSQSKKSKKKKKKSRKA